MSEPPTESTPTPDGASRGAALLDVRDLTVRFPTRDGVVQAVSELSFSLRRGETLGDRRRVRLGQERHEPRDHGPAQPETGRDQRRGHVRGPRPAPAARRRSCARSAAGHLDDLPGSRSRACTRCTASATRSRRPSTRTRRVPNSEARRRAVELLEQVGHPECAAPGRATIRTSSRAACASAR